MVEVVPFPRGDIQVFKLADDLAFAIPDLMTALDVKSGTVRMALCSSVSASHYFKARSFHRPRSAGFVTSQGLIKMLRARLKHSKSWVRRTAREVADALAPVFVRHLHVTLAESTFLCFVCCPNSNILSFPGVLVCCQNYQLAVEPTSKLLLIRAKLLETSESGPLSAAVNS